jgi:hypothetical protein
MTCPGRQPGINGVRRAKEHPEDMAAQRAARWFDMVMPAGNAAHIEARVASGLGISASQEASQSPCAAQRRRPDLGCVAGPPRTT